MSVDGLGVRAAAALKGWTRTLGGPGFEARLRRAAPPLNEFGVDPFGYSIDFCLQLLGPLLWLYRRYFRVETHGLDALPAGRVLLVANHSGQIPFDAGMISLATILEGAEPRTLRGMTEKWIPTLPWFSTLMARSGMVVGTPDNCRRLLEQGAAILVFPEGARGVTKPLSQAYRLQAFGQGFMRLALETQTPIVPVAVVGAEEQLPAIADVRPIARLLGLPAFPLVITPLPLPAKYRIAFGAPLTFEGDPHDEALVARNTEEVKAKLQSMLEVGVKARRAVFW